MVGFLLGRGGRHGWIAGGGGEMSRAADLNGQVWDADGDEVVVVNWERR